MPIISTPGQDSIPTTPPVVPPQPASQPTTVSPVQNTVSQQTPLSRIHSMNTPSVPRQITPDPIDFDDDEELFDDEDISTETASPALSQAAKGVSLSRMSEEERKSIILRAFTLVLGREPAERDYSYYRFSTLTEEGLVKSLLGLPEHKQMVENAKDSPVLKQKFAEVDLRLKQSEAMIDSMRQELQTLQLLLDEKNRHIHYLRTGDMPPVTNPQPVSQPVYEVPTQPSQQGVEVTPLPSPVDEMKSLFSSFFGRRRK